MRGGEIVPLPAPPMSRVDQKVLGLQSRGAGESGPSTQLHRSTGTQSAQRPTEGAERGKVNDRRSPPLCVVLSVCEKGFPRS